MGQLLYSSVVMYRPISAVPDSSSSGLSLTTTCSVTPPTSSLISAVCVCATRRTTFSAAAVRKPGDVTRTVYVPAGRYGSVYVPVDVVVVRVSTRVALFVATTVAQGTTDPAGSVTVPFRVPTGPCAPDGA